MNAIWKALLDKSTQSQTDFANIAAEHAKGIVMPLSNYAVLRISGVDASTFLQGQLSNDVKALGENQWQLSCACNQKGRIIAILWLVKFQAEYLVLVETSCLDLLLQELKKFGMFSKITIELDERFFILGAIGNAANHLASLAAIKIIYGETYPQTLLLLTEESLEKLPNDLLIVSSDVWQFLSINNKMPWVVKATQEKFTPHQLNLPNLNAVNFKKGCYRGQEIVARMQYLGKLKDHLYKVRLISTSPIMPGKLLNDINNKPLGEIVNSISTNPNQFIALAVFHDAELKGVLQLDNQRQLEVLA